MPILYRYSSNRLVYVAQPFSTTLRPLTFIPIRCRVLRTNSSLPTATLFVQKELLLMAAVRQMPYVPWYVMSICPRHGCSAMNLLLLFLVIARMPMASISLLKIDP